MSDDSGEVRAVFLEEAAELVREIERDLLALEGAPGNRTLVDRLFRHLHTIKGGAGMTGLDELAHYTHAVEGMLDEVRKGSLAMSSSLVSLLLEALDCLKGFMAEATGEGRLDRRRVHDSHRRTLELMGRAPAAAPAPRTPTAAPTPSAAIAGQAETPFIIQVHAQPDFFPSPSEAAAVRAALAGLGELIAISHEHSLPPEEKRQSDRFYLWRSFHLTTAAEEPAIAAVLADWAKRHRVTIDRINAVPVAPVDQERIDAAVDGVSQDVVGHAAATAAQTRARPTEPPAPVAPPEAKPEHDAAAATAAKPGHKLSSVRIDAGKLDKLINLVGELITVEARMESFENTVEARDRRLAEELVTILDDSSRILRDLQDQAMNLRMVPVGGAFDPLHRLVRDYCRDTGKRARLVVTGHDTEVDKKVAEQISAPLKHLIRNALDHGIEMPAARAARGKPPEGELTLAAYHQYGLIVIEVRDDGNGIDLAKVVEAARRKGLVDPARQPSEREAIELIFMPAVSTATTVTEVSGRGVGMDVVKRDIEALRGKVDVATEPGRGTAITVRIPQTLSIVECLLVGVGPHRYSIPLSSVEECVELTQASLSGAHSDFLDLREELVPYLRLRDLFDVPGEPPPYEKIVIVSTGDRRVGLVVDRLVGNSQTVIKPMSRLHRDVRNFLGTTILGDGSVVLILDVLRLVEFGQSRHARLKAS